MLMWQGAIFAAGCSCAGPRPCQRAPRSPPHPACAARRMPHFRCAGSVRRSDGAKALCCQRIGLQERGFRPPGHRRAAPKEWQTTMDGRKIPIPQTKKRRRKQLRKHNGLASGKGSVASYFSVVPPSSSGSSPHPPCAGVTPGARAAVSAALLVARSAKVAAALCSARVRRIFQAIDEFGRVVAAAIPARV